MLAYIVKEISLFSFFIKRFFLNLFVFGLILLLCFNKLCSYVVALITIYLGYSIIFNMGVLIICFGFFGFIYSLIYLIVSFLLILSMIVFALNCRYHNCSHGYILSVIRCRTTIVCLLFVVLILILETILTPILCSTFIIYYV